MTQENQSSITDTNKAICREFLDELHNKGNFDVIDKYVDTDVVSHDPFPGQAPGSAGVKQTMELFRSAFPDKQITFNDLIGEGDKVMIKVTVTGTHQGEFMGIPATGNKISYEEVLILRLQDGKIVEHWAVADALALMQQIGAIKQ
jgi:steroid delta-isomerase-like uncharacterized protein